MAVGKDDPGTSVEGGIGDDLPKRELAARLIARVARQMKAACLLVHMRDPQILQSGLGISHAPGEKVACGRETVELQREFGTLIPHDPAL
jgi:hypothetical protein